MTDIPKEAVEAAARAWFEAMERSSWAAMQEAIAAALPFLAPKPSERDEEVALATAVSAVFGDDYERPPQRHESIEIAFNGDEFLLRPELMAPPIARALAKRAEEGTTIERERCAKIARSHGVNDPHIAIVWQVANNIAAAICSEDAGPGDAM